MGSGDRRTVTVRPYWAPARASQIPIMRGSAGLHSTQLRWQFREHYLLATQPLYQHRAVILIDAVRLNAFFARSSPIVGCQHRIAYDYACESPCCSTCTFSKVTRPLVIMPGSTERNSVI